MESEPVQKYKKELFDHFGYNYGFAADLLEKYFQDKDSISGYWKNYFDELTNGSGKSQNQIKTKSRSANIKSIKKPASADSYQISREDEPVVITGVGARIIENMDNSLTIPTATSLRTVSVKLLEENRKIINQYLKRYNGGGKVSFTHLVAFALIQAIKKFPQMNYSFGYVDGKPNLIKKPYINFGIAIDLTRKDGSRNLMVPNIKKAGKMNFSEFYNAYNALIARARQGKIEPDDFLGTTISLTNPGGIGTVSSTPRLMNGQGCIIAAGVIEYPAEFKAMNQSALASLGVGKVMNITSTYDHRIIQGAESGEFLRYIDNLLLGEEGFYEKIFEDLKIPQRPVDWNVDTSNKGSSLGFNSREDIEKQAIILQLINMFRVRGHLIANLNPLSTEAQYHEELDPATYGFTIWDYDREFLTGTLAGTKTATLREILKILHQTYCGKIGAEYMHIQNPAEKAWLQQIMEPVRNTPEFSVEWKKRIMEKLVIAEGFEHFLHSRFIGHKRFSLEGSETLIPVLDHILCRATGEGVEEVFLGMAHRGRLNVLSNIIGKPYDILFSEFEEIVDIESRQGSGDVKYHLGATGIYKTIDGKEIRVSVASNPSHLEWVNPVVEGIVRAKQTRKNDTARGKIIPLLIHGDAAFAGQGVVAETLNLSQLKGYRTGGTIHIIINNQIGFTTGPEDARSSPYATDVAKMVQAPIIHVNGDDPEAAVWASQVALSYRQKFNKDIVIDLFGYRRHGHNEGDDPAYTQPVMYKKIKSQKSVKQIYQEKTIKENIFSEQEIKKLDDEIYKTLDEQLKKSNKVTKKFYPDRPLAYRVEEVGKFRTGKSTGVDIEILRKIVKGITKFPDDFHLNPKLKKHIEKRKELLTGNARIDWAFGEALAFGSLLLEGIPVRLSGQDSARGTFSQRHLILNDMNDGRDYVIHNNIDNNQALIEPLDSLLSEAAVMGFEFGYSAADPLALVLWEAQFGDFANSAQVIIDNFIVASKAKWDLPNNIVLLLPHGQEGQGPEHSSARLERFLTLCAEDNIYVCNPTTPAQYFHLLRRQVWSKDEKPLIILTPKSLLRLPDARSEIKDFTDVSFSEIIDDNISKEEVKKIILTSGKVYYDLVKFRNIENINDTAIVRIEQYYPLKIEKLNQTISSYPKAESIKWVQEEPQNMGAWNFIYMNLKDTLPSNLEIKYTGRKEMSSPATGTNKEHQRTQEGLVKKAFE
ncbi:MAG: multifunctional oxoglutarate decarboxylase/oxoglutarate dehydrogenase thiamine pyrophosphate-binding subunit/dihydrolipoyllysine-residue succinyltransferase subunit [Ignavibacteria bacterium]